MVKKKLLLLSPLLFFEAAFLLFLSSCSLSKNERPILIQNGELHLQNLNSIPEMSLQGSSEFYWNQLLTPSDFKDSSKPKPTGYFELPGIWNNYLVQGIPVTGMGFASFRIVIHTPDNGLYGLKINEIDCAWKIWANNVCDSVGTVGTSKATMKPAWNRKEIFFAAVDKKIEIILQVSNFHHRKGGPEDPIIFGTANQIAQYKTKSMSRSVILLGALLFMGFYYLLIYFLRRKELSALLFALLCFGVSLRLVTVGEKVFLHLWPHFPWELAVRIEYFAFTISIPIMAHFTLSRFPSTTSSKIIKTSYLVAFFFTLLYIFTPVSFFSYTPLYYQFFILFLGFYIMYVLMAASLKKQHNSLIFLIGYLFFFAVMINDILYYNNAINTNFLMPLGVAVLIFSQSAALSRQMIHALDDVEKLSEKLETYSHELESIVQQRTEKIQRQKERIEIQAEALMKINEKLKSLSGFKENMTSMVVHDMKNHLNNIILLSSSKTDNELTLPLDRIRYSAYQILQLVMNILDVQRFREAKYNPDIKECNPFSIIQNAISQLSAICSGKNLNITNSCPTDLEIMADPSIFERVFANLLSNAIRFSPLNSIIQIEVAINQSSVIFSVTDQGCGIHPDKINQIFEKFESIQHPEINNQLSTGLGLTFCKLAIEAHEGQIGAQNIENHGARFWFSLPFTKNTMPQITFNPNPDASNQNCHLPKEAKLILKPYALELSKIKSYEFSAIQNILTRAKIDLANPLDPIIQKWFTAVAKAASFSDEKLYHYCLQVVLEEIA